MLKKLTRRFGHAVMVRVFAVLEVLGLPRLGDDRDANPERRP